MKEHSRHIEQLILLLVALLLAVLVAGWLYRTSFTRQHAPMATGTAPMLDRDLMGMVIRDPWYDFGTYPGLPNLPNYAAQDRMGAMLAQMGVRWVRLEFHIAGDESVVLSQVARNDYFIREVAPRHDINVLGLLSFGLVRGQHPRLLGAPSDAHDPQYGAGIDEIKRTWLNRARSIADYYEDDIAAYEVFNEPNRITRTGNEGIPASEVARLHTQFYRHFRHIDRASPGNQVWRDDIPIILGGPQPAGTGHLTDTQYLSDYAYLHELYTSDSFVRYREEYGRFPLDGLGFHPYPEEIHRSLHHAQTTWIDSQGQVTILPADTTRPQPLTDPHHDVQLVLERLNTIRGVLRKLGDPDQPFWITEIGYRAGESAESEAAQAEFARLVYPALAARDDVMRIFWFKYEDIPAEDDHDTRHWGSVVIPFTHDSACPGGACYDIGGRPSRLRPLFRVYRQLAGMDNSQHGPPDQVSIEGPGEAGVGEDLAFTAVVSHPTGTPSITYTWQLEGRQHVVRSGGPQDSLVVQWQHPGTYTVSVEASNPHGVVVQHHTVTISDTMPLMSISEP